MTSDLCARCEAWLDASRSLIVVETWVWEVFDKAQDAWRMPSDGEIDWVHEMQTQYNECECNDE